ncbi:MAG: DUF1491 family protein [Alphaproteobacteria bacterium]|nr:MAG: DUF1491 family protein [Alphaproteobacteria bacterium]
MTDDRIPTEIWVTAVMRQCMTKGIPVTVAHKGAIAAGTVMVKIFVQGQGCKLLNQSRDENGNLGWMDIFDGSLVEERKADDYIRRTTSRDPDIWVVEVEDKSGANPFEGKVF